MELRNDTEHLFVTTVTGSVLTGVAGAGLIALAFGLPLIVGEIHPVDRQNDLARLPGRLFLGVAGGAVLGALAVLASGLPRKGVPLLVSFASIAAAAGIARLLTEQRMKTASPPVIDSHLAALLAALAATAALVTIGCWGKAAR